MALTQIDQYQVMYSDGTYFPRISLKGAGKGLGQLVFHPNGATLPADAINPNGGEPLLHYHLDDFQNTIDLLRNEKPMYLLWNGTGAENGIRTTPEPVGEGE